MALERGPVALGSGQVGRDLRKESGVRDGACARDASVSMTQELSDLRGGRGTLRRDQRACERKCGVDLEWRYCASLRQVHSQPRELCRLIRVAKLELRDRVPGQDPRLVLQTSTCF